MIIGHNVGHERGRFGEGHAVFQPIFPYGFHQGFRTDTLGDLCEFPATDTRPVEEFGMHDELTVARQKDQLGVFRWQIGVGFAEGIGERHGVAHDTDLNAVAAGRGLTSRGQ